MTQETPYFDLDAFQGLYLEDSFVLDVKQTFNEVCLFMEFVLTEEHPEFQNPNEGEQYCFRKGSIVFSEPTRVCWNLNRTAKATDASGEVDYGHIDAFTQVEPGRYRLEGDFGAMEVTCAGLSVRLN